LRAASGRAAPGGRSTTTIARIATTGPAPATATGPTSTALVATRLATAAMVTATLAAASLATGSPAAAAMAGATAAARPAGTAELVIRDDDLTRGRGGSRGVPALGPTGMQGQAHRHTGSHRYQRDGGEGEAPVLEDPAQGRDAADLPRVRVPAELFTRPVPAVLHHERRRSRRPPIRRRRHPGQARPSRETAHRAGRPPEYEPRCPRHQRPVLDDHVAA
jgi:hypothetical protein